MTALITSKNNPKVKIVTGKVNKTKMGLTIKLSKANTTATTIEVTKLSTETPPRKLASKVTRMAVTNNLIIKDILKNLKYYSLGVQKLHCFIIKFTRIFGM